MINLSLNELKLVAKNRRITDYENNLIKILSEPKTKISLSQKRIKDINEKFNESRYKFSKSKVNKIRRSLYGIKKPPKISGSKIKEIEKNLLELEKTLFKTKKYYDYDNTECKGIRYVRNFDPSIDEDYYEPIKTVSY